MDSAKSPGAPKSPPPITSNSPSIANKEFQDKIKSLETERDNLIKTLKQKEEDHLRTVQQLRKELDASIKDVEDARESVEKWEKLYNDLKKNEGKKSEGDSKEVETLKANLQNSNHIKLQAVSLLAKVVSSDMFLSQLALDGENDATSLNRLKEALATRFL